MKRALLLIYACLVLSACSQNRATPADNREADVNSLRVAQQAAIKAFVSKNADQMVAAYSGDASLMFSNSPILRGEDLKSAIRGLAADRNFSMEFTTDQVEVAKSGELGYTRGAYTMTMSDPKIKRTLREKGKYVSIYAKQTDGSWKMIEDISNADAPAIPVESPH
ncbi:MAG TPA: DUF4440 domain-containing protein [Terriglobales bacterium]|jgi:ketosteroid isomerase-like protein|nr:DUF4440 domain-containing protein [Terriglobales bacterium]